MKPRARRALVDPEGRALKNKVESQKAWQYLVIEDIMESNPILLLDRKYPFSLANYTTQFQVIHKLYDIQYIIYCVIYTITNVFFSVR